MRHAFCIIAFNDYKQLVKMLQLLDSEKSDFYIHINSLTEMPDCDRIRAAICKSEVHFTERVPIVWGENGVLTAQLVVLNAALEHGGYDYYHLLSGQDFPLKSFDSFDSYLEENLHNNASGLQYTNYIDARVAPDRAARERLIHYNWLIKYWRHPSKAVRGVIRGINLVSHVMQRVLHVNRLKLKPEQIGYGSLWYSISEACAKYMVENKEWFEKNFSKHSFAPDEGAVQTLLLNSEFKDSIYTPDEESPDANLRYADYVRGNGASPYVFRLGDLGELQKNKNFFARKFSESVDAEIVDKLYEYVKREV